MTEGSFRCGLRYGLAFLAAASLLVTGTVGPVPKVAHAGDQKSGSKPVEVQAAKITLDVPARWRPLDLSKKDLRSITEVLEEQNPELAATVDPQEVEALEFYAQDFVNGDSVEVLVVPGLLPSRSLFEETLRGTLGEVPGFELVSVNRMKVGSKKAFRARLRYELIDPSGESVPVFQDRLVVQQRNFELALVIVSVDDAPDEVRIAGRVVRSVRPLGTKRVADNGEEVERGDEGLPLEAALTEVPGFRTEAAPSGVVDAFRQALLASNDLGTDEDIVAVTHYARDDGTDAYAYVVGSPGAKLRRPISGGCSVAPGGTVVTLAGQDVCRQQSGEQWILSWGGDFTLRVLSNTSATADDLMTALISANAT